MSGRGLGSGRGCLNRLRWVQGYWERRLEERGMEEKGYVYRTRYAEGYGEGEYGYGGRRSMDSAFSEEDMHVAAAALEAQAEETRSER